MANKGWQLALARALWYELKDDKRIDITVALPSAINTPAIQRQMPNIKKMGFLWKNFILFEPEQVAEEIVDGIGKAFIVRPGFFGKLVNLFSLIVGDKVTTNLSGSTTEKSFED